METLVIVLLGVLVFLTGVGILLLRSIARRLRDLDGRLGELATADAVVEVPERVKQVLPPGPDRHVDEVGERIRDEILEEVRAIGSGVEELRDRKDNEPSPPRIAEEVEPLIAEAVEAIEARLSDLSAALRSRQEDDAREVLEAGLRGLGFRNVRIVEGPEPEADRIRVRVEANREGMTYKGTVYVRGTKIVERRLSPAHPMFP